MFRHPIPGAAVSAGQPEALSGVPMFRSGSNDPAFYLHKKTGSDAAGSKQWNVEVFETSVQMLQRIGDELKFLLDRLASDVADACCSNPTDREDEQRVETDACSFVGEKSL